LSSSSSLRWGLKQALHAESKESEDDDDEYYNVDSTSDDEKGGVENEVAGKTVRALIGAKSNHIALAFTHDEGGEDCVNTEIETQAAESSDEEDFTTQRIKRKGPVRENEETWTRCGSLGVATSRPKKWRARTSVLPLLRGFHAFLNNPTRATRNETADSSIKKGFWTAEEDTTLIESMASGAHPPTWSAVASEVGRLVKDCRDRWHNNLDPNLSTGKWTSEEDAILIEAHAKHGSHWAQIASMLPGRTIRMALYRWRSKAFQPLRSSHLSKIDASADGYDSQFNDKQHCTGSELRHHQLNMDTISPS